MISLDTLDADLQAIMSDWPDEVTFNGEAHPCSLVSMSTEDIEVLKYQFSEAYKFSIQIRKKAFSPEKGQKLTYQGAEYRIGEIGTSPDLNELRLHLTGVNG